MTSRQTNRSRVLRRVGAVLTAAVAVGAVATSAGVSAKKPSAVPTGGTLKVAIRDTLPKFCTGDNPAGSSLGAFRSIYDTLFEKTKGGDLVGMLAESATPSTNLKTWTIKLRKAADGNFIKFHDGTDLDADAVAYNINAARGALSAAWAAQATAAAGGGAAAITYGTNLAAKRIIPTHVLGTSVTFQANILDAAGTVGGDTVVITLDRAQNDLTSTLYASGRFFMRSKRQIASWPELLKANGTRLIAASTMTAAANGSTFGVGGTCGTFPIGTGPFKVKSDYVWDKDNLVVEANPTYWRKDAKGQTLPYLAGIEFKNIKEANTAKNAILSGGYHVVQMSGANDGTFIKRLRLEKSKVTEYKTPYEYYPSVWLNQVKEPAFTKLSCRQAVAYGLDRKTYVKRRGDNQQIAPKSLVGPTSVMYTTKGFLQYNLTKAKAAFKQCLTDAGVSTIDIALPADKSNTSYLNSKEVARQLSAVGFKATVATQQDSADIISTVFSAAQGNQYKVINILLLEGTDVGFNLPFLVSDAYRGGTNPLEPAYGSDCTTACIAKLGGILNLSRHSDNKVAELGWAGRAVAPKSNGQINMATAGVKFKEMTKYIQEQSLMTSIAHQYVSIFTTKKVGGVGTLKTPSGKTPRVVTNWGIQYAGLYLKK